MASGKTSSYCSLGGEHTMNTQTIKKRVLLVAFLIGLVFVLDEIDQMINPPAVTCQVNILTVAKGDTYWNMSDKAVCVGGYDKQDRVGQIIKFNNDRFGQLMPGQIVIFPTK